jgi:hypothetical protein
MLTRETFLEDWCATLGENRWLTLESVIEYVNSREATLRQELEAAKAAPPADTSFDEILVGDTVYSRAGGFRVHEPSGRNLRVYREEGNPLTQVADLKADTTDALIAELDWCIEEGQSGARTRAALKAARKVLHEAKATALHWSNGCDESVPAALRFLADNPRPVGGEQSYNAEHLYQLAGEIESTAKRSRTAAAAFVDAVGDIEAYRKRAQAAERGCIHAGLQADPETGEWAHPATRGQQVGALYQVGTRVINGMLWTDVDYPLYAEKSARGERNLRIVFENPLPELSKLGERHRFAARMAQMGACTCLTKTPEIQYHADDCTYRLFAEIERALSGVGLPATPTEAQAVEFSKSAAGDEELLRRVWQSVNSLPYMEGMTTEFARQVLRAYRLSLQLPQPLAFFLELRRAASKAPLGCLTAEEVDTLIASSMQGAAAAQGDLPLVYRQYHCLHEWAENDAFWENQPYGNRFYFGDGAFDYVPRDVLRSFVQRFGLAPAADGVRG